MCKASGSVDELIVVRFIVECPHCHGKGETTWGRLVNALKVEGSVDLLEEQGFVDLLNLPEMNERHTPATQEES